MQVLALRAHRAGDPARSAVFAQDAAWAGRFVFPPASLLVLGFGIGAVEHAGIDWGETWISIGLTVWLASMAIGAGFLGPQSKRLRAAIEAHGPQSPETVRRARRITLASQADVVLLVLAVAVMTLKP